MLGIWQLLGDRSANKERGMAMGMGIAMGLAGDLGRDLLRTSVAAVWNANIEANDAWAFATVS